MAKLDGGLFVPVFVSLLGHRKIRRLARTCGVPQRTARSLLIELWLHVLQQDPDGEIGDWTMADIADAAGWDGDPQAFVDALRESELVDIHDNGIKIHDWRAGHLEIAKRRASDKKRKRRERERRALEAMSRDSPVTSQPCHVTSRDVTGHSVTVPNVTPERETETDSESDSEKEKKNIYLSTPAVPKIDHDIDHAVENGLAEVDHRGIAVVKLNGDTDAQIDIRDIGRVVEHYLGHHKDRGAAARSKETRGLIKARLRNRRTAETLFRAIDGAVHHDFNRRHGYDSLANIMKSEEQIDRYLRLREIQENGSGTMTDVTRSIHQTGKEFLGNGHA